MAVETHAGSLIPASAVSANDICGKLFIHTKECNSAMFTCYMEINWKERHTLHVLTLGS